MKDTLAYSVEVEYYDVIEEEKNYMEFVIFAKSFAKVEKKVIEEVGEHLIQIMSISVMSAVPLF